MSHKKYEIIPLLEYVKEEFEQGEIEIDIGNVCYNELPETNPLYKYANLDKEMIVRFWVKTDGSGRGNFVLSIRDYGTGTYTETQYTNFVMSEMDDFCQ